MQNDDMVAYRPRPRRPSSVASRRLDGGDVDLLHRHHRLEGALGLSATGRHRVGQRARGDLPGEAPAVLAPTARAFLAAIADNRIPVAVRLRLIVRGDLEGERLAVLERRTAVEPEAGNAEDGELHRQHIAGLAARVVARRLVDSGHFTIRKGGGVEPRRVLCVLVEPETNRVFRFHVSFTFFPKLPIPSSANAFRSEHRELPGVGSLIVADEIRITVCAFQLEISVVGRQPGVEYFGY